MVVTSRWACGGDGYGKRGAVRSRTARSRARVATRRDARDDDDDYHHAAIDRVADSVGDEAWLPNNFSLFFLYY